MKNRLFVLLVPLLLAGSCVLQNKSAEDRFLKKVSVPLVITDDNDIREYVVMHYWDGMDGVRPENLEQPLADFIACLDQVPLETAGKAMTKFFENIVRADAADTSLHTFAFMTEKVSKYLYDPNSPYRNEDYYFPFVSLLAESPLTKDDMRAAYRYEAEGCSLNPVGSVAPDFKIKKIDGKTVRLRDIAAPRVMLFFSNPGCTACKEIIDAVQSSETLVNMIAGGTLAVVNVYIDEDLKAWKEYESNYPSSWLTGYDPDMVIRNENLYSVRAIPSLYLLGAGQTIIMKDAPTEKVISYLENL